MTPATILSLIAQCSAAVDLVMKLRALYAAGNKPLTDADWADLEKNAKSEDYLKKVGLL